VRLASIDVGSNTLRLLVAEQGDAGRWIVLHRESRIVRPSGGFDTVTRRLDDAAMVRTEATLADFARTVRDFGATRIAAAATGIWRQAVDAGERVRGFNARLGLGIRVIAGEDEAGYTMDGALFRLGAAAVPFVLLDIGGSSTELSICGGPARADRVPQSLDLGCVALTARHVAHDPPTTAELRAVDDEVARVVAGGFAALRASGRRIPARLVGTAGTITTLAALLLELDPYDPERVEGTDLSRAAIHELHRRLAAMTNARRLGLPGMPKGREDVIVAGAAIARTAMDEGGFDRLTVTEGSLLEGLLLDAARGAFDRF
jgi:exopolyphosphatase/guanosine-5'-triphosphate,3'-diphosphate pyrophosphatase